MDLPEPLRRSSAHVLTDQVEDLDAGRLVLADDVEHHLVRVLRLSSGESVTATDGAGSWRSYAAQVNGGSLTLEATDVVQRIERSSRPFTIVSAIPKGDRIDWLVQKCTELGADRIVLMHAERSVVRWKPARAEKQIVRLQRIADEALRQSRRVWRVEVAGPVEAADALPQAVIAEPGGRSVGVDDSMIAIGPEGGWSDIELTWATDRIDVGRHILRTETAAVAATILSQLVVE